MYAEWIGSEFDLTVGLQAGPFGNPNRYDRPSMSGAYGLITLIANTREPTVSYFDDIGACS